MQTDPGNTYSVPPASDPQNAADSADPSSAVGAAPSAISNSGGSQLFPPHPDSLSCSAVGVDSSSPLPSASSLAPVPETATARKPLIGDSSCLSFDFECSCTQQENKGSKASPANALPASRKWQACRLMACIGGLLLLSGVIALSVSRRPGNYMFSITGKFGRVDGFLVRVPGGQSVVRYIGVPFAVSPVEKHRFYPSQTAEPLGSPSNSSLKRRINFVDRDRPCPQDAAILPGWLIASTRGTSEDCLYMNLWTPDQECLFHGQECGTRAVIVFFHGGDLRQTGNKAYDGALLASQADVVVAIPNYRLGLLGRSIVNESEPVELGLGDQLTAVRWLKENVGLFGGNASRLTLAGHGAGAASVGHWMLSTHRDVADVQRFVMISGSPYARYIKDTSVLATNIRTLARRVQCESYDEVTSADETLSCLRKLQSALLVPRLTGLNGRDSDSARSLDDLSAAVQRMPPSRVLLLGTVPDEGSHFFRRMAGVDNVRRDWMLLCLKSQGINDASAFLNDYQRELKATNSTLVWNEAYADVRYHCPVRRFAERMANSGVTVYRFVFDASLSFEKGSLTGKAEHYATIRLSLTDMFNVRPTEADIAARDRLVGMLNSFINTGRLPNTMSGGVWPIYNTSTRAAVIITGNGLESATLSHDPCRHVRKYDQAASSQTEKTTATTTTRSERSTSDARRAPTSVVVSSESAQSSPHYTAPPPPLSEEWNDEGAFARRSGNVALFQGAGFRPSKLISEKRYSERHRKQNDGVEFQKWQARELL